KVLKNLNLYLDDGEKILLSGSSGAGKSTLFSLLLGFQSPLCGDISYSGLSLKNCSSARRRNLIGAVLQNPSFFDGTVRDNLCLYAASPSDYQLWTALEAAGAEDVVSRLSGGLDARLSGEDSGLSGGQRQRLAIARLMVHPPSLILLDEPVNALDSLSAERVRGSLEIACKGKTVLLISHSDELPMPVNRCVFLADGCIRGQGSDGND
ncbi:MAG: ATP-binding cassette domain-containing protein, partial [Spirochaetaceae bacterium]|nr:ATP-binding cassette domain-containing protein [Spirochaetaceae bacterium]